MDESSRMYLNADGRWSDQPDGATLRIDTSVRNRVVAARAQNTLYRPDGNGGWQAVTDDSELSSVQRGMSWEVWKTQRADESYHAFRGVRAVDDAVLLLLEGLLLRDRHGDVIEDPRAAGREFLLSTPDTREFLDRLKRAGGQVHRAELTPAAAAAAAQRAEAACQQLAGLLDEDRRAVAEAYRRDFSALAAFQRREPQIRRLFDAVRDAVDVCERASEEQLVAGMSIEERSGLEAVCGRAREALQRAGALLEEHAAADTEIARMHAHTHAGGPDPRRTPAARALLFRELGAVLAEDGLDVEFTEQGVRVRTPVGWIALGPGLTVESLASRS